LSRRRGASARSGTLPQRRLHSGVYFRYVNSRVTRRHRPSPCTPRALCVRVISLPVKVGGAELVFKYPNGIGALK